MQVKAIQIVLKSNSIVFVDAIVEQSLAMHPDVEVADKGEILKASPSHEKTVTITHLKTGAKILAGLDPTRARAAFKALTELGPDFWDFVEPSPQHLQTIVDTSEAANVKEELALSQEALEALEALLEQEEAEEYEL